MALIGNYCVFCENAIWDFKHPDSDAWLRQFRTIYSNEGPGAAWSFQPPEVVYLSGIGLRTNNELQSHPGPVPRHKFQRWTDITPRTARTISVRGYNPSLVFHAACWSILETFYHPREVPLQRLHKVLESLPRSGTSNQISFGYDRGMTDFDLRNNFVWEDTYCEIPRPRLENLTANDAPDQTIKDILVSNDPGKAPASREIAQPSTSTAAHECFTRLPVELLLQIALYLPTRDFCRLRQSSRAFGPLIDNQAFWASKFDRDGERGFLFEAKTSHAGASSVDWKATFRRTRQEALPPYLQIRRKVWRLCLELESLLSVPLSPKEMTILPEEFVWREVNADLDPGSRRRNKFESGCRVLCSRSSLLRGKDCIQMAISMASMGNVEYISGIRWLTATKEVAQGYIRRGEELILDVRGFQMLELAVGPRGFHALRAVFENGRHSKWVGNPDGWPITQNIDALQFMTAVCADLDGFKMVALATGFEDSSLDSEDGLGYGDDCKIEEATWYPDFPDAGTGLGQLVGPNLCSWLPLYSVSFGGAGGKYLRNLVAVDHIPDGDWPDLRFVYNRDDIPLECRQFGRNDWDESSKKIERFAIDGPGGERFKAIEYLDEEMFPCRLHIKVTTSRNRSFCLFHRDETLTEGWKSIKASKGMMITGFYGGRTRSPKDVNFGFLFQVTEPSRTSSKSSNKKRGSDTSWAAQEIVRPRQ